MYRYLLPIIKKSPFIYKTLKKVKNRIFFQDNYSKKLTIRTNDLVKSFNNESFLIFKKEIFSKKKMQIATLVF